MKLPIKNLVKDYGGLLTLLVIAVALNIMFMFSVDSANLEFRQRNEELSLLVAKKISLLQLMRDKDKLEPLKDRVNSAFVSKDKLVDFIEFLENTASSVSGSADIGTIADGAGGTKNFKLVFSGSYGSFINFLARLENSPYLVGVTRIDAVKASGFRVSLDLKVLSL